MLGYGYEKDLGLGCRLLRGQNKTMGTDVGHFNKKKEKKVVGASVGCYKGKICYGQHH